MTYDKAFDAAMNAVTVSGDDGAWRVDDGSLPCKEFVTYHHALNVASLLRYRMMVDMLASTAKGMTKAEAMAQAKQCFRKTKVRTGVYAVQAQNGDDWRIVSTQRTDDVKVALDCEIARRAVHLLAGAQ